ncbi:phage portal protein [Trueperella pyogenes]
MSSTKSPLAHIAESLGLVVVRRSEQTPELTLPGRATFTHLPSRAATSREATSLDAVYRAIFIIQTTARQLSIDVWRNNQLLDVDKRPSFLNRPNLAMYSFGAFVAETVSSLAQRGNAYWHVKRQGYEVLEIDILNPLTTVAYLDKGKPHYQAEGREINPADVVHLRLLRQPGQIDGLGPLQACATKIDGAISTAHFGSTWTRTGGAPPGILTTTQPLTKQQAIEYKAQANEMLQYENGIAVLGNGLAYQKLYFTPAELEFIETQRENVAAIARMFGIPAKSLLVSLDGTSDTYSNAEQENQQFYRHTLMAYLREIEEALTFIAPRGTHVRFNVDGLLRSDTKTRYEAHQIGINAGFLTTDEVRAMEGLPQLTTINEKETTP